MSDQVEQVADRIMESIGPPEGQADVETKKLEKPKTLEERKREEVEKLKAPDVPEQVKRTQGIIAAIHQRLELRARFVADKLRRSVEIEAELRQAAKDRDARLDAVEAAARERLAAIAGAFDDLGHERAGELNVRDLEITKLDTSLAQLRKQLDAELGKLDPDRKVTA
jgi:hypothetical protein